MNYIAVIWLIGGKCEIKFRIGKSRLPTRLYDWHLFHRARLFQ